MSFSNINSILVIKLRHIGDVLLTVPVFRALKESFPDARVSVLVNAGTGDVLNDNPLIDEIIRFDRSVKNLSRGKRYAREISFLKAIRARGFDMTVDLTSGDRAAVISFISGAKVRIGLKPNNGFTGKKLLYTHISDVDGRNHTVLHNLQVVREHGINTSNLAVDFHFSAADREFVSEVLNNHNVDGNTRIAHVHPTSRWLFKCWNDEYMAQVIRWLLDKGLAVAVTASPDNREMGKTGKILEMVGNRPGLIDLRGRTSIKQLGALSARSILFFGVDSAPMHIAAAVGTPVVALFGPSGAFNWGPWDNKGDCPYLRASEASRRIGTVPEGIPYGNRNGVQSFGMHTVIQRDWQCVPCGKDGCKGTKISRCLEEIKPEEVIPAIERIIK